MGSRREARIAGTSELMMPTNIRIVVVITSSSSYSTM